MGHLWEVVSCVLVCPDCGRADTVPVRGRDGAHCDEGVVEVCNLGDVCGTDAAPGSSVCWWRVGWLLLCGSLVMSVGHECCVVEKRLGVADDVAVV